MRDDGVDDGNGGGVGYEVIFTGVSGGSERLVVCDDCNSCAELDDGDGLDVGDGFGGDAMVALSD